MASMDGARDVGAGVVGLGSAGDEDGASGIASVVGFAVVGFAVADGSSGL
jgi:hypothetical protein